MFAEIYRKLKPGGVCIMTFSNRMFFTKVKRSHCIPHDYHVVDAGTRILGSPVSGRAIRSAVSLPMRSAAGMPGAWRTVNDALSCSAALYLFDDIGMISQAVEAWRETTDYGRCQLVRSYFQSVAGFTAPEILKSVTPDKASGNGSGGAQPSVGDFVKQLLQKVLGGSTKDPFFAVVAYRDFKP